MVLIMKNKEIIKELKGKWREEPVDVNVRVEGGLYYPIKKIVHNKDGTFTIICKDLNVTSVTKPAKWTPGE